MLYHFERHMPHRVPKIFALVADVESYPSFVPFCTHLEVLTRKKHANGQSSLEAEMELVFHMFKKRFRSRVDFDENQALISINLFKDQAAPISRLEAQWSFSALDDGQATNVSLSLEAQADHFVKTLLIKGFVKQFANTFMDAFEERANVLYG